MPVTFDDYTQEVSAVQFTQENADTMMGDEDPFLVRHLSGGGYLYNNQPIIFGDYLIEQAGGLPSVIMSEAEFEATYTIVP